MKITFTLMLLALIAGRIFAQDVDEKNMVGFGCYWAGQPSKTVANVTRMVKEKRYGKLSKLLAKGSGSEKYLAVVALEKLDSMGQYELSNDEQQQISKIKTSKEKVSVCSGCTYWDRVALEEMFLHHNFLGSNWWIEKLLETRKTQ